MTAPPDPLMFTLRGYPGESVEIHREWEALARDLGQGRLYLLWDWFQHQVEGPQQDSWGQVCVLTARSKDRVVMALPLRRTVIRIAGSRLRVLSLPWERANAAVCPIIPDFATDEFLTKAIEWLSGQVDDWDLLVLPCLVANSPFAAGPAINLRQRVVRTVSGATRRLELTGDYSEYVKTLGTKARANLRSAANRLRNRTVVFSCLSEPGSALDTGLETFYALEAAGWKGLSPVSRIPTEQLIRGLTGRGEACIHTMTIDGTPAAATLSCRPGDGVEYVYKIAYAEDLGYYSPGRVLLYEIIKKCQSDPSIHTIDFMSDSTWLSPFRPAPIPLMSVYVFRRSFRGHLAFTAAVLKARFRQFRDSRTYR